MDETVNVAVVRSDNRRGAIAQALALIAPDLRALVTPNVVLKPNLVSHRVQLPSTHPDALSATVDALLAQGAREVVVAEGATDASAGFDRFGYRRETWGRPVRYFDINRDESDWLPLKLMGVDGSPLFARVARTIAAADCRVSLALAKTHVTSIVTLSLKNMLSSIHPDDRGMMHGHAGGGSGVAGWKKAVIHVLKQDNRIINALTRLRGRLKNARSKLSGKDRPDAWRHLSTPELNFLRSVEAMNHNLVSLARRTKPHVSIIDGFIGMHREGPRHGTPIKLGVAIAGTDAVAVDAVASAVMGFDPRSIGYLVYAEAAGLGVADLDAIKIVGDPIASVCRRFVPHSNQVLHQHWRRLADLTGRGPHVPIGRSERIEAS